MQAIQDQLNFKIDTPSDERVRQQFLLEASERLSEAHVWIDPATPNQRKALTSKTKNQKKRARKAARKARKQHA